MHSFPECLVQQNDGLGDMVMGGVCACVCSGRHASWAETKTKRERQTHTSTSLAPSPLPPSVMLPCNYCLLSCYIKMRSAFRCFGPRRCRPLQRLKRNHTNSILINLCCKLCAFLPWTRERMCVQDPQLETARLLRK